jgi:hypothetical protein
VPYAAAPPEVLRLRTSCVTISDMNTVIWTTLFTVAGTLGGVLITAIFNDRSLARQAEENKRRDEQASAAAVSDRQRDAYFGLLGTARYWKSAAQEIQQEFSEGLPKDLNIDRSRILVQDLTQAVARVELVGTDAARSGAEAIYDKSIAIGILYAKFESRRSEAKDKPGSPIPEFDSQGASEAIGKLEAEIKSFLKLARREQGN